MQIRRTFAVNGKTYQSLAELAREAGISYNAAVKRHQRGFSDYEIFFGKKKLLKAKPAPKKPSSSRSVNINGEHYDSIKKAHQAFRPKASYNTVKQRIIVGGWTDEEAFELVERKKEVSKTKSKVRKRRSQKSYIVDDVEYNSIRELAEAYKLTYPLVYNRISRGWSPSKAVKEPITDNVVVNGTAYKSALAAWETVGKTSYITFQGRKNRGFSLEVCLGLVPIPRKGKYKIFGKVSATLKEVAKEFNLTVGQLTHRLQTMSLEEAVTYTPQNKGQYNSTRFRDDPKLAETIGNFYFVQLDSKDGTLHKVGITLRPTKRRLNTSQIKIIAQFQGAMKRLFDLEQQILNKYRDNHYRAEESFDGRTETFVFSKIEEVEVLETIKAEISKIQNNST